MAINESDRAHVALTFTTRVTIEGVTGDLVLSAPSLAELRKALRSFPQAGIEPAAPVAALTAAPVASTDDAPLCKYHGKMKASKFGGWHCTAKMGDGSYCEEKVKA
jgi:hypothetical protein